MQTGAGRNFITETSVMAGREGDNNTVNNINGQFYAVNGFTGALPPPPSFLVDNNGVGNVYDSIKNMLFV